eukprot:6184669-Amphidinium_carterae.1
MYFNTFCSVHQQASAGYDHPLDLPPAGITKIQPLYSTTHVLRCIRSRPSFPSWGFRPFRKLIMPMPTDMQGAIAN